MNVLWHTFIYTNYSCQKKGKIVLTRDDIRMIKPIETEDGTGSLVTFNNNDSMKYRENPQEIECKEWQMRYLWPNVERIMMAIIGGIIGGLLTLVFKRGG